MNAIDNTNDSAEDAEVSSLANMVERMAVSQIQQANQEYQYNGSNRITKTEPTVYTTAQLLEQFEKLTPVMKYCTYLVVMIGINDIKFIGLRPSW